MKRMMILLLTAALTLCGCAALAETDAGALTWEELRAWADGYLEQARAAEPMNDPHDAEALTDDGYMFVYDFATLWCDSPDMTEETKLRGIVVTEEMSEGPRGTRINGFAADVLGAFYSENPDLDGDRSFAALYLSDTMPSGAMWGWVQRDGQRIETIQYAVHEQLATGGDGYTDAGIVYTLQEGLVAAIRAYGLDSRVGAETVNAALDEVRAVAGERGYTQVPTSPDGSTLAVFGTEDLQFAGIDLLTMAPEDADLVFGAAADDVWLEDGGSFLRTLDYADCTLVYRYDGKKKNGRLLSMSIHGDRMEGPRAVRLGDSVAAVLNRFRNGEGAYDDAGLEALYGTQGEAPYATAQYGGDASATLRYVLRAEDGRTVELMITFTQLKASEILLLIGE